MRSFARIVALLSLALVAPGCAQQHLPGTDVERASHRRMDLISREEIESQHWANAYELVSTLRPSWLNDRGTDSFSTPAELQVHLNGVRAGGVAFLRQTSVSDLVYLEYIDPIAATARWGLGYGKGAIDLSTRPK